MVVKLDSREYYLSYFKDMVETPEILQDKMLKVLIADGWCEPDGVEPYWSVKKNLMIEYFDRAFPKHKRSILNARLNELMQSRVIVKSIKYKTKPYLIKGTNWDSRVRRIQPTLEETSTDTLVTMILMGDNPDWRARYIADHIGDVKQENLDI
tara:strand:+ start:548 stop:1006 length:459 start_codon:yes stop_codon:yes gene_type:complete